MPLLPDSSKLLIENIGSAAAGKAIVIGLTTGLLGGDLISGGELGSDFTFLIFIFFWGFSLLAVFPSEAVTFGFFTFFF